MKRKREWHGKTISATVSSMAATYNSDSDSTDEASTHATDQQMSTEDDIKVNIILTHFLVIIKLKFCLNLLLMLKVY